MASGPSHSPPRTLRFVWTTNDEKGTPDADSSHDDLNHYGLQVDRPRSPPGTQSAPRTAQEEQADPRDRGLLCGPPQGPPRVLDDAARRIEHGDRSEPAFKLSSGESGPRVT